MTIDLSTFRQLQRFSETTVQSLEEHQVQHSNSRKAPFTPDHLEMRADSLASTKVVCQLSTSTSRRGFPLQHGCERDPEFAAKSNGHRDALTRKKAGFPYSGLNAGSSFISQGEGMSESTVETLEKALFPHLIWTAGLTSL